MFTELDWSFIDPNETKPASLGQILNRFVNEAKRTGRLAEAQTLFELKCLAAGNLRFIPRNFPQKTPPKDPLLPKKLYLPWEQDDKICPFFPLVDLAAQLTGKANAPTEYERFLKIYCGQVAKEENSVGIFGPLSGRRGTDYVPFSQCWSITEELHNLVQFMQQPDEVPEIPSRGTNLNEDQWRKLLVKRKAVATNNDLRGQIFAHWQALKQLSGEHEASGQPLLPPPSQGTISKTERIAFQDGIHYDATPQINLRSPEYQQTVEWVNSEVRKPLLDLIGERNLQLGPHYYLNAQDTAANCSRRPRKSFVGAESLLSGSVFSLDSNPSLTATDAGLR